MQNAKCKTADRRGRRTTEERGRGGGGVKSKVKRQKPKGRSAGGRRHARREVALEVALLQEPERGPARRLLVGLKRELGRAPLQHPKRMLLQCLARVPVR